MAEEPKRKWPELVGVVSFHFHLDCLPPTMTCTCNLFQQQISLGTRRCCDVESTSLTLILRRNNVVCPVGCHCHLIKDILSLSLVYYINYMGGGPRVVVSTAAFHARVRGSVPGLGGLKETKMFLPHPRVKVSIVGSLRDREVACSASDRQGSNFESCVWRTVSSQSSHHPQEVLLAQFSLYVHKGGLKPDSFHLHKLYIVLVYKTFAKGTCDIYFVEN